MNLNWFESMLYGLFSGLTDILPVSAQAHKAMMLKIFGTSGNMDLMNLLIHFAIAAALYINCRSHLVRMNRASRLARIPKKKRKRPLDVRSMMDLSMLKTILVPAFLGLLLYRQGSKMHGNLMLLALFLFLNGVILYVPQFLPSGNRDSRTLSRVEGLLMGLGGTVSVIPGISAIGTSTAIASVCGVERSYGLNMALMMQLFLTAGLMVYDVIGIINNSLGTLSVLILLRYLFAASIAFCSSMAAIKLMRRLAAGDGYSVFAFYCFGLALFTFIFNLMA